MACTHKLADMDATVAWISVPLIVTMLVAMVTVHWESGWQAIADPGLLLGGGIKATRRHGNNRRSGG
jgi:uncharacterized membrane protein YphA (DoxX/SURF4 family)